jgi:hypothetical protein
MSGYRFCRTDDIPLLVEAYNACCGDRRQTGPPLTVDGFKHGARALGLWASSCMIAFDGETPIAVLLGAKREDSISSGSPCAPATGAGARPTFARFAAP